MAKGKSEVPWSWQTRMVSSEMSTLGVSMSTLGTLEMPKMVAAIGTQPPWFDLPEMPPLEMPKMPAPELFQGASMPSAMVAIPPMPPIPTLRLPSFSWPNAPEKGATTELTGPPQVHTGEADTKHAPCTGQDKTGDETPHNKSPPPLPCPDPETEEVNVKNGGDEKERGWEGDSFFHVASMPAIRDMTIRDITGIGAMGDMSAFAAMPSMPTVFSWTNAVPEKGASTEVATEVEAEVEAACHGAPSLCTARPESKPSETETKRAACTGQDKTNTSDETSHNKPPLPLPLPDPENDKGVRNWGDDNKTRGGEDRLRLRVRVRASEDSTSTLKHSDRTGSDESGGDTDQDKAAQACSRTRQPTTSKHEAPTGNHQPPRPLARTHKGSKKAAALALAELEQRIGEQNRRGCDTGMPSLVEQLQHHVQHLRSENE